MRNALVDVDRYVAPVSVREAQRAHGEIGVVEWHPTGEGSRCGEARPARRQRDQVVEVETDHLGVDQVKSVGSDTGDSETQRELGVRRAR